MPKLAIYELFIPAFDFSYPALKIMIHVKKNMFHAEDDF